MELSVAQQTNPGRLNNTLSCVRMCQHCHQSFIVSILQHAMQGPDNRGGDNTMSNVFTVAEFIPVVQIENSLWPIFSKEE